MEIKNPVLILGLYNPGYALLRNFALRGIPVYGADVSGDSIGFETRYGTKMRCPNPIEDADNWLLWMKSFAEKYGTGVVILPTSDKYLIAINDFALQLKEYGFIFTHLEKDLLKKLTSKKGIFELATNYSFPIPKTIFPKDESQLLDFLSSASFPLIAKPEFSKEWEAGEAAQIMKSQKVKKLYSTEEAVEFYKLMNSHYINVLFQEIIEGEDSNLVYQVTYISSDLRPIVSLLGRKVRITPIHFGCGTYVELLDDDVLIAKVNDFLVKCGFRGVCGIELKYDAKDSQYKLIEINPRTGLWDEIGNIVGKDFGYSYYKDILGDEVTVDNSAFEKAYWVSLRSDFRTFWDYKGEGMLTFETWVRSLLKRPILFSDFHSDDIKLSVISLISMTYGFFGNFYKFIHRQLTGYKK